jgi:hypothetical protein
MPLTVPNVFATTKHLVDTELYWQNRLEASPRQSGPTLARTMTRLEEPWRELQDRRLVWLEKADPHGQVDFEAAGGVLGDRSP